MNIIKTLDFEDSYYRINREERNLAAILYHLFLSDKNNIEKLLKLIKCPYPIIERETEIYFEFAFLRDLWNHLEKRKDLKIDEKNNIKKKLILDSLNFNNRKDFENMSIYDFNKYFGAIRKKDEKEIISKKILSPGYWSIKYFNKDIDNKDFLEISKFKWCFNAKPDIVIQTSKKHVICIETKFESYEGKYPTGNDKTIFNKRGIRKAVSQIEIQKKIIQGILEYNAQFLLLMKKQPPKTETQVVTWKQVFSILETSKCPHYIKEWIKQL